MVIANVFPRLQTVKTWLDHSLESAVSEDPLAVDMLKRRKRLRNLHEGTLITLRRSVLEKISLIKLKILGVFVNTVTADENYPFGDSGNFQFPIQMHLP